MKSLEEFDQLENLVERANLPDEIGDLGDHALQFLHAARLLGEVLDVPQIGDGRLIPLEVQRLAGLADSDADGAEGTGQTLFGEVSPHVGGGAVIVLLQVFGDCLGDRPLGLGGGENRLLAHIVVSS